ncbi:DUF58 domain-containing protein [Ornithinibacillus halotolerans]|uniref:DUF58 domain-containing protein n=1 Tax=Ornithinibacillus halotolerans TaxID=1274357 RepID=A0A916W8X0_9BACI|nr:DUF58 domain-containing protein [Ornithinibacillus halotolerans]GGA76983.1 hypothetical protein GCM10008025_20750 [Ornithinibacillus halotolerans]
MMWRKEAGTGDSSSFDYILLALLVFFIVGVIFKSPIVFIAVGIFTAYLIAYKIYDKSVEKSLSLKNEQRSIKLFPGEETSYKFEIENRSMFPLINGEFTFQIGSAMKAYTIANNDKEYWKELKLPLSIIQKKKTVIEFPLHAEQRGVARVKNISYDFPHLLNFSRVRLRYYDFHNTEFIVYPKLLPVHGANAVFHMMPGESRLNFSPFEDVQSPLGTRDYSYSDPFHKINWKATVKTQKMQTNIYEKVVDRTFVFIINLSTENDKNLVSFNKNLENLLSYTAYLSEYATKMRIPFEIYINARKPGKTPYIHLHEGEGKTHYMHALEMLARVHKQAPILPFNKMMFHIGKQFIKPKTIIFIGDLPSGAMEMMNSWKQAQNSVYQVVEGEGGAGIRSVTREAIRNAT